MRLKVLLLIPLIFSIFLIICLFLLAQYPKITYSDTLEILSILIQIILAVITLGAIFYKDLKNLIFPPTISVKIGESSVAEKFIRLKVFNSGEKPIRCHARIEYFSNNEGYYEDYLNLGWANNHEKVRLIFPKTSEYLDLICLGFDGNPENIIPLYIGYTQTPSENIKTDPRYFYEGSPVILNFFVEEFLFKYTVLFEPGALKIDKDPETGRDIFLLHDLKKIQIKRIY